MQLRKCYILVLVCFLLTSCATSNCNEIYYVAINKKVKPLPSVPPPTFGDTTSVISERVLDSITRVPMKIAVKYHKIDFNFGNEVMTLSEKFDSDKIHYFISDDEINFKEIKARPSLSFTLLSGNYLKNKLTFEEYDGVLQVSDVKYNEEKDEGLVIIAYSNEKLSSTTVLYYMEKKKDEWYIKKMRSLSKS